MKLEDCLVEDELLQIAKLQLTNPLNSSRKPRPPGKGGDELLYSIEESAFLRCTIEQIGAGMPTFIDGPYGSYLARPEYWKAIKEEMHKLVCTNDKKYADIRRKIESAGTKSQTTIVSLIAAAVAVHVGIAAGALVPFCALCLVAVARVGKNAFCNLKKLDVAIDKQARGLL